jgi:hypothetical protein
MRPAVPLLVLLLAAAPHAAADTIDATRLLGMDPAAAVAALGAPGQLFAWRGSEPARDTVVFYYPDAMYLFWYKDRVWQVRFDRRYPGSVLGLTMGMFRDLALAVIGGRPSVASGDSLYVDLAASPFPVRARLVFDGDVLSDLYVYRSDF